MILKLPSQINAPRFRKDGSCSISFDTRELSGEELMYILGCRNSEGWLLYSSNRAEIDDSDVPEVKAELDIKSSSARLKDVLFVWYKQETQAGKFTGLFETFYKERMERIIEGVKSKLHD